MCSVKMLSKCLILHFKHNVLMNVDLKGRGRSQDMLVIGFGLELGHLLQFTKYAVLIYKC